MVTNWDGLDAKAFAGIYNSNWVCSVDDKAPVFREGTLAPLFCTQELRVQKYRATARLRRDSDSMAKLAGAKH